MRSYEDFRRLTYEAIEGAAGSAVGYCELAWNPTTYQDVGIPTQIDGIRAGLKEAEKDFGIRSQLLIAVNRMESPEVAVEMVECVLNRRRGDVIGLGLDHGETGNPPEKFWKAYRIARQAGMHLTAHACWGGPPRNVETCLDLLGCERIDHGYRILEDEKITQRCINEGIVFTVTPTSTSSVPGWDDLSHHPIQKMAQRGLKIMFSSDDPPMVNTTLTQEYQLVAEHMDFSPSDFKNFVLNGIEGAFVDDITKQQWKAEWSREIDEMITKLTGPTEFSEK